MITCKDTQIHAYNKCVCSVHGLLLNDESEYCSVLYVTLSPNHLHHWITFGLRLIVCRWQLTLSSTWSLVLFICENKHLSLEFNMSTHYLIPQHGPTDLTSMILQCKLQCKYFSYNCDYIIVWTALQICMNKAFAKAHSFNIPLRQKMSSLPFFSVCDEAIVILGNNDYCDSHAKLWVWHWHICRILKYVLFMW